MRVYLLGYLRPEKKFASPQLLVKQIQKDMAKIEKTSLAGLKS
jgi:FAD synthase